jgi:mono/diheme cytochrome c family protein
MNYVQESRITEMKMRNYVMSSLMAGILSGVAGCSEQAGEKARQLASSTQKQTSTLAVKKPAPVQPPAMKIERNQDMAQIVRGGKLYQQHCAECHGMQAEGAPNWQQPGPDGKWPPPALNGTAHAWHHPMAVLKRVIRDGTQQLGGNMPPWGDKLNEQEMEDIIAWFQAKWPDELYAAWYRRDQQSRQQGK